MRNSGTLLEHHKVEQIQPGSSIRVITSKGVLTASNVVITAGLYMCVSLGTCTCMASFITANRALCISVVCSMSIIGPWTSRLVKPLGLELPLKVWKYTVCTFMKDLLQKILLLVKT